MAEAFKFGEGATETMKNFIAAVIGDVAGAEMEKKPDDCHVISELEDYVSYLPSLIRMGLVWLIRGLEVAPLAMGYRHQFSNLTRGEQVKVLKSFEDSQNYLQRGIMIALKSQVMIIYFSEPEVEAAIGYRHECLLPH